MTEIRSPKSSVYPRRIEDEVYLTGFASPKSYGAMSHFIRDPGGNWLVDSPRWEPYLAEKFAEMGGLKFIFLTHQDDVADAGRYAQHFGAQRIIHEADRRAAPGAEIVIHGQAPHTIKPGLTVIPVPGHTKGHCVLLYRNKFLFTGDHLEWDAEANALGAYRDYCWYDWGEQTKSMKRLLDYSFEWVLPGHGRRIKLTPERMKEELRMLVERMEKML